MEEKIIKQRTGYTHPTESKNNFNQNCYKTDNVYLINRVYTVCLHGCIEKVWEPFLM